MSGTTNILSVALAKYALRLVYNKKLLVIVAQMDIYSSQNLGILDFFHESRIFI